MKASPIGADLRLAGLAGLIALVAAGTAQAAFKPLESPYSLFKRDEIKLVKKTRDSTRYRFSNQDRTTDLDLSRRWVVLSVYTNGVGVEDFAALASRLLVRVCAIRAKGYAMSLIEKTYRSGEPRTSRRHAATRNGCGIQVAVHNNDGARWHGLSVTLEPAR